MGIHKPLNTWLIWVALLYPIMCYFSSIFDIRSGNSQRTRHGQVLLAFFIQHNMSYARRIYQLMNSATIWKTPLSGRLWTNYKLRKIKFRQNIEDSPHQISLSCPHHCYLLPSYPLKRRSISICATISTTSNAMTGPVLAALVQTMMQNMKDTKA